MRRALLGLASSSLAPTWLYPQTALEAHASRSAQGELRGRCLVISSDAWMPADTHSDAGVQAGHVDLLHLHIPGECSEHGAQARDSNGRQHACGMQWFVASCVARAHARRANSAYLLASALSSRACAARVVRVYLPAYHLPLGHRHGHLLALQPASRLLQRPGLPLYASASRLAL